MPWAHFTGQLDNGKVWVDRCVYCDEVAYVVIDSGLRTDAGTVILEARCFDHEYKVTLRSVE